MFYVGPCSFETRSLQRGCGNGESIRIFYDPWIPSPLTFKLITPNFGRSEDIVLTLLMGEGE